VTLIRQAVRALWIVKRDKIIYKNLRHNNQTIRKKLIVKQNIYTCTMYIYWYSSTVSMSYNLLLTNPIPIESLS